MSEGPLPHEKPALKRAYVALAVMVAATFWSALTATETTAFSLDLPALTPLVLAALAAIVGVVATLRRDVRLVIACLAIATLSMAPADGRSPDVLAIARGLLFALSAVAFMEFVHMTTRYERAHTAVEREGVPESHLDTVIDEASGLLVRRGLLATGLVLLGVILTFILAAIGPARWRVAIETMGPLGITLATLVLLAIPTAYVLARRARLRRDSQPAAARDPSRTSPPESTADATK